MSITTDESSRFEESIHIDKRTPSPQKQSKKLRMTFTENPTMENLDYYSSPFSTIMDIETWTNEPSKKIDSTLSKKQRVRKAKLNRLKLKHAPLGKCFGICYDKNKEPKYIIGPHWKFGIIWNLAVIAFLGLFWAVLGKYLNSIFFIVNFGLYVNYALSYVCAS